MRMIRILLAAATCAALACPAQAAYRPAPHVGAGAYIYVDDGTRDDEERSESREELDRLESIASGRVSIAPATSAGWIAKRNIAANTFELRTKLTLPRSIAPEDVASIYAVFSDAVDPSTVEITYSEEMTELSIKARAAMFETTDKAELLALALERSDGAVLLQRLRVGVKGLIR